jgi:hypothetical protein
MKWKVFEEQTAILGIGGDEKMASGRLMNLWKPVLLIVILMTVGSSALADVISVGSGVNTAGVYIEWSDGYWTEFEVKFGQDKTDTTTGLALLQELDSAGSIDFTLTTMDYGWGIAIEGIEYVDGALSHYNPGWVEDEEWWHYWIRNAGEVEWSSSLVGSDVRIVSDGDMDGWIYGRAGTPLEIGTISDYDPNDFAIEVVEYVEGDGVGSDWITKQPFNDPNAALGKPALETTGDGWFIPVTEKVPVVPLYPPFRAYELVTIGNGGHLTVKFSHPIANDENNPYGIDFIIFGDAYQIIGEGQEWSNGNPEDTLVSVSVTSEPGIVAVSQDGESWYYFTSGPYADGFAPTAGRQWDDVNDLWTEELDPTRPVDPNLNVGGMSLAEMITAYDGSAGGTGFDIGELGLQWIQYIRIEDDPNSEVTTEIDAIADVSCCGDYKHPYPVGDLNKDCRVDYDDFDLMILYWKTEIGSSDDPAVIADINGDGIVNFDDWLLMADNWLECTWQCE